MQKILIIFNREPYDGTDITWNGLHLAETLRKQEAEERFFLMNDSGVFFMHGEPDRKS